MAEKKKHTPQPTEPEMPEVAPQAAEQSAPDLEAEICALREQYLRLAAEYDNFRKRSKLERDELLAFATASVLSGLLPIYDTLRLALQSPCADENYQKGFLMVAAQFDEAFEKLGLCRVGEAGEPFDPELHNAVLHREDENLPENAVAEVLQPGFVLGDKVIRHATVVVAN